MGERVAACCVERYVFGCFSRANKYFVAGVDAFHVLQHGASESFSLPWRVYCKIVDFHGAVVYARHDAYGHCVASDATDVHFPLFEIAVYHTFLLVAEQKEPEKAFFVSGDKLNIHIYSSGR